MDTRIFHLDEINQAAKAIQDGKLVAFPTETVYGLGADATNEAAVKNVYLAKERPSDNPLIVHVASVEMVERYASVIPDNARKLMKKFWPGSLTIILNIKKGVLSKTVTGGLSTVAFRFPDCQPTLDLIKKAGVPIVGPSANTSGKPSPTTAQQVYHDLHGKIAGIIDNGPTRLENNPDGDLGLKELKEEFPEIKDISDLPESVVENARLKGTLLLDEYLRYRHTAKRNARKAAAQSEDANNASIGSQTDRRGGVSPETAEFLKGLWR